MIIWSGWGIQVPLYVVLAFFLVILGLTPFHLSDDLGVGVGMLLTGALAGGAIYFTARWQESKPGREFIDAKTNEHFTVRPSAGSFFFVPTRYWAFIVPLLGFILGGAMIMNPPPATAEPVPVSAPARST